MKGASICVGALVLLTLVVGCSGADVDAEASLEGLWKLDFVQSDREIDLVISREEGWFDSHLETDCGMDGPFGDWSGDWREVEVDLARSPSGTVSGSIVATCIVGIFPARGYLIEAMFFSDSMVGRMTAQVDRGNKNIGPVHVVTDVHLFVAAKRAEAEGDDHGTS